MGIFELILVSIGLAMDAFAVSLCKGLRMKTINYRQGAIISFTFGFFQALMPLLGWTLGLQFEKYITTFDHWIAFVLLFAIGGKMLWDAFHEDGSCPIGENERIKVKELFLLAIATSIDALAVGITLAFLKVDILLSVSLIGIITFAISFFGVVLGHRFGTRFQGKAEMAGGIVLILIGIKILCSHLGILMF
ncbi:manganese efflux pump MntP family protein [Sphaerochaeta pleomorpha]|uniref:manganese efflux pump MntP n=1 Tax=Sphaerochaeta pleomorpha TaxID=1131707 RepID=UPI0002D97DFF|nr:manganese efflux pump MntP family protein [Sphaerochaeta pleomorpha]